MKPGDNTTRRLWFRKKSGGPATSLLVRPGEIVDDVKSRILQKYPTSLQQQIDPADLVLTVPQPSGIRLELQPDEVVVDVIQQYFGAHMAMSDALEIGPPFAFWNGSQWGSVSVGEGSRNGSRKASASSIAGGGAPTTGASQGTTTPQIGATSSSTTSSVTSNATTGGASNGGNGNNGANSANGANGGASTTTGTGSTTGGSTTGGSTTAVSGNTSIYATPQRSTVSTPSGTPSVTPSVTPSGTPSITPSITPSVTPGLPSSGYVLTPLETQEDYFAHSVGGISPPETHHETVVPQIKMLIVEDNRINQRILERFLMKKRVRFESAQTGREALDKWRTGEFHLILMDIQLPVMTGLEATKEIRRLEAVNGIGALQDSRSERPTPNASDAIRKSAGGFRSPVIIVALTASSDSDDLTEALAAGCNDFLTKPVNFAWLERKIIEWGCMQALIDYDGWKSWNSPTKEPARESTRESTREPPREIETG